MSKFERKLEDSISKLELANDEEFHKRITGVFRGQLHDHLRDKLSIVLRRQLDISVYSAIHKVEARS